MSGALMTLVVQGGAGVPALSTPRTVNGTSGSTATVLFKNDGRLSVDDGSGAAIIAGEWLTSSPGLDTTTAALYEIRRTQTSGTIGVSFVGTMTSGSWFALNSDRGVQVTASAGARSNVSTWEIRLIAGPGPVVATVVLTVVGNP